MGGPGCSLCCFLHVTLSENEKYSCPTPTPDCQFKTCDLVFFFRITPSPLPTPSSGSITHLKLAHPSIIASAFINTLRFYFSIKDPASVVAEGIPPIPTKLLEKIRRWEFIDLSTLSGDQIQPSDNSTSYYSSNHIVIIDTFDRAAPRKRKAISDMFTWVQAYLVLMAALASDPATSKEESVVLIAHQHIILQIA